MKQRILRLILFSLLLSVKASLFAYEFSIENSEGVTFYFNYTNNGTELEITKGTFKYSGDISIPEEVTYMDRTRKVTRIGYKAFSWCTDLTSLTVPNTITSIGDYAFEGCGSLKKVIVQDISAWCGIEFAEFYSNPLFYARHLYSDENTEITDLVIPSSVTSIGRDAFDNCDFQTVTSKIEEPFTIVGKTSSFRTFSQNTFNNATLYVPKGTINKYKATSGWKDFLFIEESETTYSDKCEKPTITYQNGTLTFHCATEGVSYRYSIEDADIKAGNSQEVQLGVTYNISVYATKEGYENSETTTATLCWIDAEPKSEGLSDGIAQVSARAVMVKAEGGLLTIEGAEDNCDVRAYTLDGVLVGSCFSQNGIALVEVNFAKAPILLVKIGKKSVKVIMK